jgi:hypothetical protein
MSNSPFDPNSSLFPWYEPPPQTPLTPSLASLLSKIRPEPQPIAFDLGVLSDLLPKITLRPRIFVSYQHSSDQYYYNEFSRIFHDGYESVYDNSLERIIDSEDCEYVIQRIRDEFITGTSCTILLVGPTSYQRKYLDWEIKATLEKEHGLIGIQLPNVVPSLNGQVTVPTRFVENVRSGYALWHELSWRQLIANPALLNHFISDACSRPKDRIVNRHEIKKQNG